MKMHVIANGAMLLALVASLLGAGAACLDAWRRESRNLAIVEKSQLLVAFLFTFSSGVLLKALASRDFSFAYVAQYTDSALPLFYALTAFWAGQAGSFLFWAWTVALLGGFFLSTSGYRSITSDAKVVFWLFYLLVQAFFLVFLTGLTNPFEVATPPPADGQGLNPLLQNPGMIFHPPLLFFGYAGFTVPAALALACRLSGEGARWIDLGRNWVLASWAFLTAGIVLGGWWSYMELGWGGYWAWDPVENASLVPWFAATAFVHAAAISRRRGALPGASLFLIVLTLLLCFFATYLVRSGVVQSLHAFGDEGVGTPLFFFLLSGFAVLLAVLALVPDVPGKSVGHILGRPGTLLFTVWLLGVLGLVVAAGTIWPVISKLWVEKPVGLTPDFYNRVCLPLFTILSAALVLCPWLGWSGGVRNGRAAALACLLWLGSALVIYALGFQKPFPLLAASASIAALGSALAAMFLDRGFPSMPKGRLLGAYGAHAGVLLMILGVAFSGPYETALEVMVKPGESFSLEGYNFSYVGTQERAEGNMQVQEALIVARKSGEVVGELTPQRRVYSNSERPFSEVSTIPSAGTEIYATLQGVDAQRLASIKVSLHPLVNWIWIGGTIASLAPFLALRRSAALGKPAPTQELEV